MVERRRLIPAVVAFALIAAVLSATGRDAADHGLSDQPPTFDAVLATSISPDAPGSFVVETVATGFAAPTDITFATADLWFVSEKSGVIKVVAQGSTSVFVDLSGEVNDARDRGLLGIAVHPRFTSGQPWLYAAYAYDPPETVANTGNAGPDGFGQRVARIVRIEADASTGFTTPTGQRQVVVGAAGDWTTSGDPSANGLDQSPNWACGSGPFLDDCIPADATGHSIGDLAFGPDESLFVGVGQASEFELIDPRSMRALDVDSLAGKILRVDPVTGQGVPGNPHWTGDPNDNASRVWYSGLRNPFRFSVADGGGLWVADVGRADWEELNHGAAGADFGWPCFEGGPAGTSSPTPGYSSTAACIAYTSTASPTAPVWALPHGGAQASLIGGDIVPSGDWPASLHGSFIAADFVNGWLRALDITGGPVTGVSLATEVVTVSSQFSPDGHLHLVDIVTGSIERIRHVPDGPSTGRLRVTTSPPTPASVVVNGTDRSEWGLDWLEVPAGTHEVCFRDNPTAVTPPCRNVEVPAGGVGETVGVYEPLATLVVTTRNDLGGVGVESTISVDGRPADEWGLVSTRPAGTVTVCFGPAAGHVPPPCQSVGLVAGQTTEVVGTFAVDPAVPGPSEPQGLLRVALNPAIPSTLLIDGLPTREWALDWLPMPPGEPQVCLTDVPGYVTPPCRTARVDAGQVTTMTFDLERQGDLRVVTSPPTDATISVDGVPRNQWGLWTSVDAGTHEVCVEFVAATQCRTTTVTSGQLTVETFSP